MLELLSKLHELALQAFYYCGKRLLYVVLILIQLVLINTLQLMQLMDQLFVLNYLAFLWMMTTAGIANEWVYNLACLLNADLCTFMLHFVAPWIVVHSSRIAYII